MGPITDRRERARKAFDNEWTGAAGKPSGELWAERLHAAREAAIGAATRVKITPKIIYAIRTVTIARSDEQLHEIARAAFVAAGFEVES